MSTFLQIADVTGAHAAVNIGITHLNIADVAEAHAAVHFICSACARSIPADPAVMASMWKVH